MNWLIDKIPTSILTIIYILLLFIVGLFLSHLLEYNGLQRNNGFMVCMDWYRNNFQIHKKCKR